MTGGLREYNRFHQHGMDFTTPDVFQLLQGFSFQKVQRRLLRGGFVVFGRLLFFFDFG